MVRRSAPLLRFQNHPPPLRGGPASGCMEGAFVGLECPWWSKMQRGSARGLVGCHWGAGCHWVGGEVSERVIIAISLVGVQPPSFGALGAGCRATFCNCQYILYENCPYRQMYGANRDACQTARSSPRANCWELDHQTWCVWSHRPPVSCFKKTVGNSNFEFLSVDIFLKFEKTVDFSNFSGS